MLKEWHLNTIHNQLNSNNLNRLMIHIQLSQGLKIKEMRHLINKIMRKPHLNIMRLYLK